MLKFWKKKPDEETPAATEAAISDEEGANAERDDPALLRRPPAEAALQRRHLHRKDTAAVGVDQRRRFEIAADGDQIAVRPSLGRGKRPAAFTDRLRGRRPVSHVGAAA